MNIGAVFEELVTAAKGDDKVLLPLVGKAIVTLSENPTRAGVIIAGVELLSSVVAVVEPKIAQDLAGIISQQLQDLVTQAGKPSPLSNNIAAALTVASATHGMTMGQHDYPAAVQQLQME